MDLFQNMNLQKIVLVMAIFAFLFAVFIITYKLMYSINYYQSWPPSIAKCPDYWEVSGAYCVNKNGMNKGTLEYDSVDNLDSLYKSTKPSCYEDTCILPISAFGNNNKKWASTNKVVWDGLNNTSPLEELRSP